MRTTIVKWVSMAALALAVLYWEFAPSYQLLLNLIVSTAAIIVITQAVEAGEYRWASGFAAIAVIFNPAAPFAVSLLALKPQALLSVHSITDRNPGSESL